MSTETKKPKSFAARVWATLKGIDCSGLTEKKKVSGGRHLTYLSWAGAWEILMDHFPESSYEFGEELEVREDGTTTVWCSVTVRDGEEELTRKMWLPVMTGFNNNAKQDPDARDIGDTRMRCLVKCLGLFGLGLYIYQGEDVPKDDAPKDERPGKTKASSSKPAASSKGGSSQKKKSPPNDLDGKPAHPDQLTEIEKLILVITECEQFSDKEAQDKQQGIIDYVNGRRENEEGVEPCLTLAELTYIEAEQVLKMLGAQAKKGGH